ncbi:hypothetical protein Ocin01_10585 [Orchesella cincta]|uniref:Uncharacterized protein n=1 Tax=Orchesella cincta TaxID=48709 RepID=A0A1D2MTH7_ORCCI|nr:hypothetical protein Ocin01_10585 [Orchesella cincta]
MRNGKRYTDSDSDSGDPLSDPLSCEPLSLIVPNTPYHQKSDGGKSYMVLSTDTEGLKQSRAASNDEIVKQGDRAISFTSLLNSITSLETFLQTGSAYLLQTLNSSQRIIWFIVFILFAIFFYPLLSTLLVGGLCALFICGHQSDDKKRTSRTAKWTVTGFSQQLRDGFLASPAFLDKSGQWRMVVKQKRGMDGVQTSFGLLCTDIYPQIELVTANVTFFCTNKYGQELNTGGMRNLKFQQEYQCAGDAGFSRPTRFTRRQLGEDEAVTIHCSVEFHKKTVTFLKTLVRNLREDGSSGDGERKNKKGKNIVTEHGTILPGNLEFQDDDDSNFPSVFRPLTRFVHHSETKTFVWEIPDFTTLLESSELWGIYSPQFFLNSHDICSIWRMKLLEVQGVFRLHVQLRGLPRSVKQVKLWYLLQLVDNIGDSVIPEHAVCRVKYPDHMNLWDTTRHILYRRETILERFVTPRGALSLRISLQMEPNDLALMEVDSDDWIQSNQDLPLLEEPHGVLKELPYAPKRAMLTN